MPKTGRSTEEIVAAGASPADEVGFRKLTSARFLAFLAKVSDRA